MQFQRHMDAAAGNPEAQHRAMRGMLRLMFPPQWSYILGRDPVRGILALDTAAQTEVLRDFFEYLARTLTGTTKPETTPPSPPLSTPTPPPSVSDADTELTSP